VPFPVKVKSKVNIKINVKGVGQECPAHMGKILGLKPAGIVELYAALKRRSSTVPHTFDKSGTDGAFPIFSRRQRRRPSAAEAD
jgi:hypothetical protein